MARRRMFSLDIVDSDQFTDLPPMARLLYYELGVRADDDGFVGNPKKITRFAECSENDIKMLEDKGFIYMFMINKTDLLIKIFIGILKR